MTDVILAAVITAVATVIGQWLVARKKDLEREKAQAVRDQRIDDRLEAIERRFDSVEDRLDDHNGYAEKFASSSKDIQGINIALTAMQKDIEYIKEGQVRA